MMSFAVDYDKITVLEVGITSFGNEGYAVKYDFVKKVIQWRDSYMWNNNFTRSLNDTRLQDPERGIAEKRNARVDEGL